MLCHQKTWSLPRPSTRLDLRLPGINVVDHFAVPQEIFETFHRTTTDDTDDIMMIS